MTAGPGRGPGSYARAIEQALSRLRQRPVVLSPRDWALVSDWFSRGIPLALVLEVLEDAAERSRRRHALQGPRSLAYVAAAVEESWQAIVEGRGGRAGKTASPLPSLDRARERWAATASRSETGRPLRDALDGLLRRLDTGLSPESADREIDETITALCPGDLLARVDAEIDAELRRFRDRMKPDVLAATRGRARIDRLRRELDLPKLALSDPEANVE